MCSLSSYKQRERRECGYSRRFYRLNVYTTNLYPPTGALDSKASKNLLEIMTAMNRDMGATILMVTHDAYSASYAKRVLFLKDGRVFNELLRGDRGRSVFYHEILDVLAALGGDVSDVI